MQGWPPSLSLNLNAVLAERMKDARVKILSTPLSLDLLIQLDAFDIFLTDQKVEAAVIVDHVNRPAEGWIQIVLPKESAGKLFKGSIGIKTDWYDNKTNKVHDNEEK